MIVANPLTLQILPLLSLVLVWVISAQVALMLLAPLQRRSYVAWSLGLLGFVPITSSKPSAFVRFLVLILPLALSALAGYEALMLMRGLPIKGLSDTLATRLWIASVGAVVLDLPRLAGAIREVRFPLWGEARVLDRVARSVALGNAIHFTAAGRVYISERFGATPEEFLRIVRRRSSSLATGTPS
jgi:hypothetical protein